jgi:cullin 1
MASSSTTTDFTKLPSKQADLAETWTYLNGGVDHIMKSLERGLSFAGYTNLYTTVYNYCTSTKMHGKMDGNRCGSLWADSYSSDL